MGKINVKYKSIAVLSLSLAAVLFLCQNCAKSNSAIGGDSQNQTPTSPSVSVLNNQSLTHDPHLIDYYVPSNATSAIVFLHGGGGSKEGIANSLGIKNDNSTTDWDVSAAGQAWLIDNQVMMIFPQGQTVYGNNTTWSNYVMNSGVDDVAFLQNLAAHIRNAYPQIAKIYLAGHSNGGMMVNRMWCESPATFDAYASLAGPPSPHLAPAAQGGTNPCSPNTIKPYIGVVGDSDHVLQSLGNMNSGSWTIDPFLVGKAAKGAGVWVDSTPTVLNDLLYLPTRVSLACGGSVGAGVQSGWNNQLTTYSSCSGSIQEVVVSQKTDSNGVAQGGDHCLGSAPFGGLPCTTSLPGDNGFDPKALIFGFLHQY